MSVTNSKTIFVGGFANHTDAQLLHKIFSPFGEIIDLQLPPDPSSESKHRGFAFVTYSTTVSAINAIDNMHRNIIPTQIGKTLKVNLAKQPKQTLNGSRKAIWTDEGYLQEMEGKKANEDVAMVA